MPPEENATAIETAMQLADRSIIHHPLMLRTLVRSQLWFLMPPHPEMEGEIEFPLTETPPFIAWKNKTTGKHEVPLFTSQARFDEYRATKESNKSYALACGDGRIILGLIARANYPAVVNPGCASTKSLFLPPEIMAELANGTFFKPLPAFVPPHPQRKPGELAQLSVLARDELNPDFINPVWDFLAYHSEFKAAWLVKELNPDKPNTARVLLVIETRADSEYAEENLGMVARYAAAGLHDCVTCKMNPKSPDGKILMKNQEPFYPAPKKPRGKKR